MPDPLVHVDRVTKRFGPGQPALDAVSGKIGAGAITGLVGPDGAGKTTLIRLMAGLLAADGGSLRVLGFDPAKDASWIHAAIGYMPQRFGLYEDLTVQENLQLYAELRGLPAAQRPSVFDELLTFTALEPFTARRAGKLSGGMKQKLGLACALIRRPRLLLLDEPCVGVDPISRRELWAMVTGLRDEGVGIVWSTAYLDEAEACDHVLLLNEGKLLFEGPPDVLTRRTEGRVFRLTGISGRRRLVLAQALSEPEAIDGVVQGRAIRLVARDVGARLTIPASAGPHACLAPARPRFEDSFVDVLGGGPGGRSVLAEAMRMIEPSPEPVVVARGLTKRFGGFTAAEDISFEVPGGEIFGLLGPNGAGKSTTFRMLCGLLRPTSGEGRVAGIDLRRDMAGARSRLGYMAQKFSLYGDLSVRQNMTFFAGVYGLTGERKRRQIERMIEVFGLGDHLLLASKELPLGFKQRLALACAVMHEPEALFLDEPTSGVDPITRREFWTHINGLVERGVAVVVTTHFMEEAEYCDRISLVYRGRSIALGSPDELKSRAVTAERPEPTMDDAFVALIAAHGRAREAA
ncbi:MAG TPA: ATP-binding cassette domain-containing protein [Polyangiaceae bacterium]|nr:ATP-binding cassette domain-containing protein [Polyangiaceae bacterium]